MKDDKRLKRKVRNSYIVSTVSIMLVLFLLGSVGYLMVAAMKVAQTLQENGEVLDAGYSTITELRETEHLFLLHCGRQQWYFVNKAGFTKGTPDEFRTFISERIGG